MLISPSDANRDLLHSRPLDVHTWSFFPQVNVFVNEIHEKYFKNNNQPEKDNGKHHLKKVLIDLYLAWSEDPELCIAVDLNNNAYTKDTRYSKLHITKKTIPIIQSLAAFDLIDLVNGHFRRGGGKSFKARMWPTGELIEYFKKAEFNQFYFSDGCYSAISRKTSITTQDHSQTEFKSVNADRECIILKKRNPNKKAKPKQIPIPYEDNENTIRMRSELMAFNGLLVRSHITLGFLDSPYLEIRNYTQRGSYRLEGDQPDHLHQRVKRIPVNQSFKFTTRQFSNQSWTQGGRFYGGWWQQIPSQYRPEIRINNTPTTEIDYSGHHCVLLYAQKGINYWSDIGFDPYSLSINESDFFRGSLFDVETEKSPEQMAEINRQCVKLLFNMLLNAETEKAAFSAFRYKIRKDEPSWADYINWNDEDLYKITNWIKEKHSLIADHLGTGVGIKLQFVDSEITSKILKHFTDAEIVVLPIHDSYVVPEEYGEELRLVMEEFWREEIEKCGASSKVFDPIFQEEMETRPMVKQIGYHDELFDPEEEGGGAEHKAMRLLRANHPLSSRFMNEYMRFNAFSAEQGWQYNTSAYNFYKANYL